MNHRPASFRSRAIGVLASVLAVAGLAPQPLSSNPVGVREQATLSRVGNTPQKSAAGEALGVAPGQALAALLGNGGGRYMSGGGVPPHIWGMSRACKRMVTKHAHAKHVGYRRFHA